MITIKHLAYLLLMLVLFQSCTVYKSSSVTLEEAYSKESKTKIESKIGETFKFKRIYFENGNYYGEKKIRGEVKKIILNPNGINNVKIKDITLSIVFTIALPITVIAVAALIFQDSFKWKEGNLIEDSGFSF